METVVIRNQKGEKTELTKLNYPVEISEETEDSFQVTFPVVLREEYQVCAVSVSYPVCQDEPLQKDRAEWELTSGVMVLRGKWIRFWMSARLRSSL